MEPETFNQAAGIRLTRWKRYGKDRLYVQVGEARVGWVDLLTGVVTRDSPTGWTSDVDLAVDGWKELNGFGPPTAPAIAASPGPPPEASFSQISYSETSFLPASAVSPPDAVPSSAPANVTSTRGWRDLAKNRPGEAALAEALHRTTRWSWLARLLGVRTQDQSWREGARGERKVGRTLRWAALFGWRALHAVPVGERGSDIDHVLIGPGGVVTINTKHHPRKRIKAGHAAVFVAGQQTPYARNSQHEAERAARLLSAAAGREVRVSPVLAIVGARRIQGSHTGGVRVLSRGGLLFWLWGCPKELSPEQRRDLFDIARRDTTWRPVA